MVDVLTVVCEGMMRCGGGLGLGLGLGVGCCVRVCVCVHGVWDAKGGGGRSANLLAVLRLVSGDGCGTTNGCGAAEITPPLALERRKRAGSVPSFLRDRGTTTNTTRRSPQQQRGRGAVG